MENYELFDYWKAALEEEFSNKQAVADDLHLSRCSINHWYKHRYIPIARQLQLICRYPKRFKREWIDDRKAEGLKKDILRYLP